MKWEYFMPLISIIFTIVGGIAGYFIKYILDKKSEAESRIFIDKREHYRTLILCLKKMSKKGGDAEGLFWFEYSFLWLYAPDSVVQCANKLVEELKSSKKLSGESQKLIGELLINIRKDMGLKTALKATDYIHEA